MPNKSSINDESTIRNDGLLVPREEATWHKQPLLLAAHAKIGRDICTPQYRTIRRPVEICLHVCRSYFQSRVQLLRLSDGANITVVVVDRKRHSSSWGF